MPNTAQKIEINELGSLFEALKEGSSTSLPDALKETIQIAKSKGLSSEELQSNLESYGIKVTEKFQNWLKNNF